MERVVLFGVGSPLVIDLEETCARLGMDVVAAVQNVEGPVYVSEIARVRKADRPYPVRARMPLRAGDGDAR